MFTSWLWASPSGRGIELLVERVTELRRHHRLVRDTEIVAGALAQELQVGFPGQDQAGDGVVEQGADGENGLGARPPLPQPVVGDLDVIR